MGTKQDTDGRDIVAIGAMTEIHPAILRYLGHHMGNSLGAARNALEVLRQDFQEHDMVRIAQESVEHAITDLRNAGILRG